MEHAKTLGDFNRYSELQYGYETDLIRILYYDLPENYYEKYASYEYPKLCTILEGRKEVKINKTEHFEYDSQEIILLPPQSSVEMKIKEHTKALVFELSDQLMERLRDVVEEEFQVSESTPAHSVVRCELNEKTNLLTASMERIKQYMEQPAERKKFLIDLSAQEMAYHLLQMQVLEQNLLTNDRHPVFRAIRDIQEQLPGIRHVKDLADNYNMSHANFTNQFKKITGLTPLDYITNQKMQLAKQWLQHRNVTEVAFDLNYESVSYFIGLFKKKYGITPKQYQMSVQRQAVLS
ncbi:AraC family transcriptional regulator [Paenibacillus peoriae]|uniref:helix-turn-helix transcriptional regulator n=1 Tax=Paenibacillus peoriae TaxID=59893 RepID=UPI00026C5877|nr:AraC family transcriptional regulator [Paenibacillus peoriae]MEC0184288.1 AraC family transcriptional regulator [Paenibacillus peoriae]